MAATLPSIFYAFGGSLFSASAPVAYQVIRANSSATAYELVTIYSRSEADSTFATAASLSGKANLTGGNTFSGTQLFVDGSDNTTASINGDTGVITGVGTGLSGVALKASSNSFTSTLSHSSGTVVFQHINPTDSTTGTGGIDCLKVTRSGSGTGSGAKNLLRLVDGSTDRLTVTSAGDVAVPQGSQGFVTDKSSTFAGRYGLIPMNGSNQSELRFAANGLYLIYGGNTPANVGRLTNSGSLILGSTTDDGVNKLQVNGGVSIGGTAPASASATGVAGSIRWDADYIYVCTATNTWKRAALATW